MDLGYWLPLFFAGAMGLALLIYVVLDGYDLGIGLLLPFANEEEKMRTRTRCSDSCCRIDRSIIGCISEFSNLSIRCSHLLSITLSIAYI